MAGRFVSRRTRGIRRQTDWSASTPQTSLLAVAGSSQVLSQTFVPSSGGETIVRVRGRIAYGSDQTAATESQLGAYGIAVVTAQAVSVGITAIPHPDTDASWDGWLYHTYLASHMSALSSVGVIPDILISIDVDSKAMRKISPEERMVFVIQNSASTGFQIFDSFRVLTKLH